MMTLLIRLCCFGLINLAIAFAGYFLLKRRATAGAWLTMTGSDALICFLFWHQHPIIKMLAIIATTFTGMKAVAATKYYQDKPGTLNFTQWLPFALGWAGMNPRPFEAFPGRPLNGAWIMIRSGLYRILIGLVLIGLVHQLVTLPVNKEAIRVIVSAILLVAFSLILHFGILSISAGMWRFSGVNTYLLFREPAKAASLGELWGKRWNLAFSEMTSVAVFRPLVNKTGRAGAFIFSFLFSGLLHELALSVPVNAGYGLPTLYFFIQAMAVLLEKRLARIKNPIFNNRLFKSIWLFCWLVIPMPLLFHPEFIKQVIWPMAGLKF
jgi:hypothetical protein